MILVFHFAGSGNFENETAMKLLGVFLSNGENKTNEIARTILPDILTNIAAILSWIYLKVKSSHEKSSFHISFKKLLCFFILCGLSVSSFSIMNFGYLLIALSWSLIWCLDISLINFKLGSFILSWISLIQFICIYWYHFLIENNLSISIAQKIGILSFEIRDFMNFIFILLLFYYSTYCRRLHITYQSSGYDSSESIQNTIDGDGQIKEAENIESLDEPIIHKENKPTYRYYISFNALYTIGRLSIFIWTFYFMSWVGICLLLWLFYSVIDFDISRVIKVTRFTLIPILSCDLLAFFIINIIDINIDKAFGGHQVNYGPLDATFQLFAIFIMLCVIKYESDRKKGLERSSRKVTFLSLSVSIILENSNKFSLCVLFVIGLSAINIVHLGYMLFFLVFILNSTISKKYWIYLVAYTELVLLVKYIWILIMASGDFNFNWLSVKIIGLPTSKDIVLGFFPDNYLEWLLLLSAAMQLNAYRAFIKRFNFRSSSYRSSIITRVGSVLNQWVNYLYAYITFLIIFLIMFLSDLNVFNFFRFSFMCVFLCMLLMEKSKTISQNLARVHKWWFIFNYYSGFLLVFRYLFQFMEFFDNVSYWESKILGIQVYSSTHLYQNMISDCLFVVLGVIFSRIYKRLHSQVQNDIGTFSLLIHTDEESNANTPAIFLVYCGKHFSLFIILIASLISIYSRLSLSMLFYIVTIGNYAIILTREFISGKQRNVEAELKHRCSLWNYLYIWCMLCLIASYLCFLISRSIFNSQRFNILIWIYFFSGFNKSPDNNLLLLENYDYVCFVISLIIERYCIEYVQSHKENIYKPNSNENIELLKFFKVIIESLIPAVLLLIAFKKLTVVSIIYVFTVLCTIGMQSTNKRVKSCNYIVVAMVILQYTIYLSNLDDSNSPRNLPNGGQTYLNIPWYKTISWTNNDYPTFLNLGTNHTQVSDLICEILLILLIQVYFLYFSKIKEDIDETIEISPEEEQSKLVKTLINLKKKFYSSFNYIILCVGLLFISKSTGLISLVYCFICLSFIWSANDVLKSKEALDNYIRLYRNYLIRWMAIEFTCQILYQIPAQPYYPHSLKDWLSALGLVQLWSAGENHPPSDIRSNQYDVYFRIYAYGALLIAYRIMQSQEFKNYLEDQRIKLKIKSKCIGIGMAHHFNNNRIKKNVYYRTKQQHFEHGVKRLDRTVEKWNRIFYENDRHPIFRPRKSTVLLSRQETLKMPPPPKEDSFKTKFQRFLIRQMNPILYRKYIDKLKHPKKESFIELNDDEEEKIEELDEENEESISFGNIEKEPENEEDNQNEFTVTVKDYFLIVFFIIASNTQGLVYLIFFLNHFYNASLESLVYPISVCGYALLEYPRPPAQYFLIMQLYSEVIFFIKYSLQLNVWELIFQNNFLSGYKDAGKLGFNLAENTYSNNLVDYVLWDALCMLILLIHQFYLLKVGLHEYTEFELETLEEAYMRNPEGESMVSSALSSREEWSEFNQRPKLTCIGRFRALFQRLLPSCKEEKPGKDMYTSIILIQFLILIYLFCFFSKMSGDSQNISNSFQANQFPGHMVIALIFHIFVMLMERYLYLERTSQTAQLESKPQEFHKKINWNWQLVTALILHLTLLIAVHLIIFWYFPVNGNIDMSGTTYCEHLFDESRCNNFQINPSLQWFYIIYMCYFVIIAMQLQIGLPIFRTGAFPLMKSSSMTALVFFQIYRGLPFLFELRTLIDWTFTTTSLSLFQWFKFEDIYARLYINKCDEEDQKKRKPGQRISKLEKIFMGACILLFILLCILAPLIIFSSLNPIIDTNPVKSIMIEIGLKTDIGNYFQLFKGSQVASISKITEKEWNNMKFDNFGKIQASDRELMQSVVLNPNPDDIWSISPSGKSALCASLDSNNTENTYYLQMTYSFNRDYPEIQKNSEKNEKTKLSPEHISDMNNIICKQTTSTFQCDNCFSQVIKLPSSGSPLVPTLASDPDYMMGVEMELVNDGGGYWQVNSLKGSILDHMHFYVISYNYSPVTFNFSVITFYISVVYLVGRLLRMVVVGGAYNIQMTEMPNPDPLINLCTGIYVSRMTGDLLREEELYFELMDILRSPEIIKMVTGRSSLKNKTD